MAAMPRPTVSLIAAVARNGGIGKDNALLMRLPDDLAHFKRTTLGSPIVMGRKTWDSIGRPLPGRRNVVVTANPQWHGAGAERATSFDAALALLAAEPKLFVIGGARLYADALPQADELVLTEIDADLDAEVFFPPWPRDDFIEMRREPRREHDGLAYSIATYARRPRS